MQMVKGEAERDIGRNRVELNPETRKPFDLGVQRGRSPHTDGSRVTTCRRRHFSPSVPRKGWRNCTVCAPEREWGDRCEWRVGWCQLAGLTLLMLKSGTRMGGMAARVNQSFHSRGRVRSVRPACTVRPSRSTGDSLKRKI